MPVREVGLAQAPEALRLGEGVGSRTWHAHGGALYSPLFQVEGRGADPDTAYAALAARAGDPFPGGPSMNPRWNGGETVVDYAGTFRTAHRKQGLKPPGGHRMRSVEDDGMAGRDAEAASLSRRLLLVDGVLMHPSPLPYLLVERSRRTGELQVVPQAPYEKKFTSHSDLLAMPGRAYVPAVEAIDRHPPWMAFEPWRGEEAADFTLRLASMGYDGAAGVAAGAAAFEVVAGDALRSAAGTRGIEDYARAASASFLHAASSDLHLRPDGVLLAMMAHRRAVASLGAGSTADEAMDSLRAFAEAIVADGDPGRRAESALSLSMRAEVMLARYDAYERPRAGMDARVGEAEASLAGLAP